MQTYSKWEVIFWDNQSSDKSAEIFLSFKEPRFKYFLAPKHTRLYDARNQAIEKAQGEFIAFLDVDDWWEPEKLKIQIPLFENPTVGVVYGNYWYYDEIKGKHFKGLKIKLPTGWILDSLLRVSRVALMTVLVRRTALIDSVTPCDPRYHIIGDFDLYVRLAKTWQFDCVDVPVATYRWHGNNETLHHQSLHMREWMTWLSEAKSEPLIFSLPGFRKRTNSILAMQALMFWDEGRYSEAIKLYRELDLIRSKARVLVLLLRNIFLRKWS